MRVKLGRRTVGCRSLRAALPAPREGDARLLLAGAALDDLEGLRDRRGRRAPSLKKLSRKVGPRAYRTIRRAIPQGLARMDRLASAPARAARSPGFAVQAPACAGSSGPTQKESYGSSSGGQKMTATVTLGAVGTLELSVEGRGHRISVSVSTDDCSRFDAPRCPTAAGVVDATDGSTFRVSLSVERGDTVLMSRSADYSGRTRMHAEVGVDAKLDFIDIDDTQTANIAVRGEKQQFGPVNLIYTGIHDARVDMPSGSYVPGQGAVDISLSARGLTVGRSALGQVGNDIAAELDRSFATLVGREIGNFRNRENGWNKPNECVAVQFRPASRTLKLSRGQRGSLSAQAVAKQGGGAAHGRWTRTGQQNGSFSPDQLEGPSASFSYEVTNAGRGIVVGTSVRVTSRAGVGEASWEQETESSPLYLATLTGTRGETYRPGNCGGGWDFTYGARLADFTGGDQPFAILRPGDEGGGARGYDETGSGTYALEPCNALPGCSTNLSLDPASSPHLIALFGVNGDSVGVDIDAGNVGHGENCGYGFFTLGSGSFPRSAIGDDTITVAITFNSEPVYGNGTLTLTRVE